MTTPTPGERRRLHRPGKTRKPWKMKVHAGGVFLGSQEKKITLPRPGLALSPACSTGDSVFFMSHSTPVLGKTNVDMLQAQIRGLQPDLMEHRTLDFVAGFIMGKTMAIEAIQRMWGAAEIIAMVDPETHLTVEEMREITCTLKTIAATLDPR